MGQTFELEVIMIEEIVEFASILEGENHRPFLVHLFQAFFCAFVELRALEEPVEQPAQKESRFEIERIGIVDFFAKGIQCLSPCFSVDIDNWIPFPNQVFCGPNRPVDLAQEPEVLEGPGRMAPGLFTKPSKFC